MILRNVSVLAAVVSAPFGCLSAGTEIQQASTKLTKVDGAWKMIHQGKEVFIKGAGGNGSRPLLLESGANSIRTWGAEGLGEVLDQAQKDGLLVTAGIWLEHRGGFDYGDPVAVKRQLEMCREIVRKHKSHPALLAWAFGNEMEGDGRDDRVWDRRRGNCSDGQEGGSFASVNDRDRRDW